MFLFMGRGFLAGAALALSVSEAPALSNASLSRVAVSDRFGDVVLDATFCREDSELCVPLDARTDGTVFLLNAAAGTRVRILAKGFEPRLVSLSDEPSRVVLDGTSRLSFQVHLADGVEETSVSIGLGRKTGPREAVVETKEVWGAARTKEVVFSNLPPGSFFILCGGPQLVEERRVLELASGKSTDLGIISLRRGRVVEGLVLEASGLPIRDATVELVPEVAGSGARFRAVTIDDGVFRLVGVPWDVPYRWRVTAPGWKRDGGRVGGESRLVLTLAPAPRVRGRVVSGADPVAGANLMVTYVIREKPRELDGEAGTPSDTDGAFLIYRTRNERVQIEIRAPGFLSARRELGAISTDSPQDEDLGKIDLSRGRTIHGVIRQKSGGTPIEGVRVTAFTRGDPEAASYTTDPDGRFSLSGLPEKTSLGLTASHQGFARAVREVAADADSVDVELSRGGRLDGRVCGTPQELAETTISMSTGDNARYQLDPALPGASGKFTFENLEPGTWLLQRSWRVPTGPNSYSSIGTSFLKSVSASESRATEVSIGCEGYPVSGHLLLNGQPLVNVYAELASSGRPIVPIRTDAQGRFATVVPSPGLLGALVTYPTVGSGQPSSLCTVPIGGTQDCEIDFAR